MRKKLFYPCTLPFGMILLVGTASADTTVTIGINEGNGQSLIDILKDTPVNFVRDEAARPRTKTLEAALSCCTRWISDSWFYEDSATNVFKCKVHYKHALPNGQAQADLLLEKSDARLVYEAFTKVGVEGSPRENLSPEVAAEYSYCPANMKTVMRKFDLKLVRNFGVDGDNTNISSGNVISGEIVYKK